jgi:hypothetical protein
VYVPDVIRSTEALCFVADPEPFARDGSDLGRGDEHGDNFRAEADDEPLSAMAVETDMELTPTGIEKIMRDQATDDICRRLRTKTSARSLFDIDERGILVRMAPLDGVRQIFVTACSCSLGPSITSSGALPAHGCTPRGDEDAENDSPDILLAQNGRRRPGDGSSV